MTASDEVRRNRVSQSIQLRQVKEHYNTQETKSGTHWTRI